MKKRLRWVIAVILNILLCAAVFYAIFIVEEISTPKKLCATLQEAVDADKEFSDYIEIMARSEMEGYTFVVAKMPDQKKEAHIQIGVFPKTDRGWISPAKGVFPFSMRSADVGDSFCFINFYRVIGARGYCIHISFPDVSGKIPAISDSMNSDFGAYGYQSVPSIGYDAWAILPELPDDYTVYVNQEPIVIK